MERTVTDLVRHYYYLSYIIIYIFIRMMVLPASVIYYTSYDNLKVYLGFREGYDGPDQNYWAPALAGVIARGKRAISSETIRELVYVNGIHV